MQAKIERMNNLFDILVLRVGPLRGSHVERIKQLISSNQSIAVEELEQEVYRLRKRDTHIHIGQSIKNRKIKNPHPVDGISCVICREMV